MILQLCLYTKKPIYKKKWFWIALLVLAIFGQILNLISPKEEEEIAEETKQSMSDQSDTTTKSEETRKQEVSVQSSEKNNVAATDSKPKKQTEEKNEKDVLDSEEIDTSVFIYATDVEVTDALEITEHIDVVVHMSEKVKKGLAVHHVISQMYNFLQQDKVKAAKTVTIGVMSGNLRVAQLTVDMNKFEAGEHIINSVMDASKIDKMDDEVRDYGEVMELW